MNYHYFTMCTYIHSTEHTAFFCKVDPEHTTKNDLPTVVAEKGSLIEIERVEARA